MKKLENLQPFYNLMYLKQGTGIIRYFLKKKGSKARIQVVGKAVYRGGGYGIKILFFYKFIGQPRNVDMLNKL